MEQARKIFQEILDKALTEPTQDWLEVQTQVSKALRKLFFKLLERRPMILPLDSDPLNRTLPGQPAAVNPGAKSARSLELAGLSPRP